MSKQYVLDSLETVSIFIYSSLFDIKSDGRSHSVVVTYPVNAETPCSRLPSWLNIPLKHRPLMYPEFKLSHNPNTKQNMASSNVVSPNLPVKEFLAFPVFSRMNVRMLVRATLRFALPFEVDWGMTVDDYSWRVPLLQIATTTTLRLQLYSTYLSGFLW